jgi:hypothetical protein
VLEPGDCEPRRLVCAECGAESDDRAEGWQALILSDDEKLPLRVDRVETWCPECAAREFDQD